MATCTECQSINTHSSTCSIYDIGCHECREWAALKASRNLPTAGDIYCAKCGSCESEVARAVKSKLKARQ